MLDLTTLYRSTIGFDHLAEMLDDASAAEAPSYPPYNIERVDDDTYRITMAVAGFCLSDLEIKVEGNALAITGKKAATAVADSNQFLHQGIASRAFERRFQLADFVKIHGAQLEDGLLHVLLKREVPEAMRPRTIVIEGETRRPKVLDAGGV
jgi:molecular chaperone IbpA